MRTRAADDAARWRAEADEESRSLRETTEQLAYEIRKTVWETGTALMTAALEESERLLAGATEEALALQADAERESVRLVSDARKERDDTVRSARDEAELLVATARQEADALTSAARRQVEAAEERARALEVRRGELMAELEVARATISGVHPVTTIEAAVDTASPEIVESTGEVPVAPLDRAEDPRTHWSDDEGSVRIVSPDRVMSAGPVDADDLAAEVEALRRAATDEQPVISTRPEPPIEPVAPPATVPPPAPTPSDRAASEPEPAPAPEPVIEPESVPESQAPAAPEPEPVPEPVTVVEVDPEPEPEPEPPSEPEPIVEPAPEPEPEPEPDPLAGLFAQLRGGTPSTTPPAEQPSERDAAVDEEPPEPPPDPHAQPDPQPASESEAAVEPDGIVEPPADESADDMDPFGLRERYLLPVQNRALRAVKRRLVEVQNQALEDLRLNDGWIPDASIFGGDVRRALTDLARESMVAGFAAAAEMVGATGTPQPADVDPGDPSETFVAALVEAARGSVEHSRQVAAGHRETASSLSRVFRAWRTDDAERRIQHASLAAYHRGLVAALRDLGTTMIEVVPSGRPCAECPAGAGSWPIDGDPPDGSVLPPARLECACAIIPSS